MDSKREEIARAIWNVRREDEDRCDMELEDISKDHSVWREADAVLSSLQPSQESVVEVVRTAPKRIWLQVSDDDGDRDKPFPHVLTEGITWCHNSVIDCEVEYIRADLTSPLPQAAQPEQAAPGVPEGWIADPDSIPKDVINACRDAICREFGNNGTDGYYKRILAKVFKAMLSASPSVATERDAVDAQKVRNEALEEAATELIDFYNRTSTRNISDFAAAIRALQSQPAEKDAEDARRYRILVASGDFAPSMLGGWRLRVFTESVASKEELDAAVDGDDAAIAAIAQQENG